MLRFCRAMHSVSILHMDIKPDNWLLTSRPVVGTNHAEGGGQPGSIAHSLSLIDFGRAIDLSIFPHNGSGVAFSGSCCASNFSCPAMTEVRVWPTSYVVLCLRIHQLPRLGFCSWNPRKQVLAPLTLKTRTANPGAGLEARR